jgi:hypothetical protein
MVEDAHRDADHTLQDDSGTVRELDNEAGMFAADLRKLREEAGQPSLRSMASAVHYSHTALSGALSGGRLPSLELTLAFVRACGGDEDEWRARWHRTNSRLTANAPQIAATADQPLPATTRRTRWLWLGVSGAACMLAGVLFGMLLTSPHATSSRPHSVFLGDADLARYCQMHEHAEASLDGTTAYDWHCTRPPALKISLSVIDLCRWQYRSPSATARYDDFHNPYSWQCWDHIRSLGRPDLEKYCQARGHANAILDGPTINLWHCVSAKGVRSGIDEDSACRWQYGPLVLVANPGLVNAPWEKWDCWG